MQNIDLAKLDYEQVVIPNDLPTARERVIGPILEQAGAIGYCSQDQFALRLGLEEAISNAYRHGNHCDPDKDIRVKWCVSHDYIVIIVADQGAGFDPGHVPDPREPENREKPSGRGVMLMRAYMSDVRYNRQGNEVCMIKARRGAKPTSRI